jgi:uncharacterized membrane protein SpoIIM required for sporulation
MKQASFETLHASEWSAFERLLEDDRRALRQEGDFPRLYRRVCQHLALARDRAYGPDLVDRLNALALRGHRVLYGAEGMRRNRLAEFFLRELPRRVREERATVLAAALLFLAPLALVALALQRYPDFVAYLLSPRELADLQRMYDPANPHPGVRAADSNVLMFAFYIWNNVKIGFQTFAGGMLLGLGTIVYLVLNGLQIGAAAGYLTQIGYGVPFWSFIAGHSAPELTAIVLSGAAGLRLGAALIAPGRVTRRAALAAAARRAVQLVYGAAALFTFAAFVEAFWSPLGIVPAQVKYAVGAVLWSALLAYLGLLGGRYAR